MTSTYTVPTATFSPRTLERAREALSAINPGPAWIVAMEGEETVVIVDRREQVRDSVTGEVVEIQRAGDRSDQSESERIREALTPVFGPFESVASLAELPPFVAERLTAGIGQRF